MFASLWNMQVVKLFQNRVQRDLSGSSSGLNRMLKTFVWTLIIHYLACRTVIIWNTILGKSEELRLQKVARRQEITHRSSCLTTRHECSSKQWVPCCDLEVARIVWTRTRSMLVKMGRTTAWLPPSVTSARPFDFLQFLMHSWWR
jgi:hypothetical protein